MARGWIRLLVFSLLAVNGTCQYHYRDSGGKLMHQLTEDQEIFLEEQSSEDGKLIERALPAFPRPQQASVWHLDFTIDKNDLAFYLHPKEVCQVVSLCGIKQSKKISPLGRPLTEPKDLQCIKDKLTFFPLEHKLHHETPDGKVTEYFYPITRVVLNRLTHFGLNYTIDVWTKDPSLNRSVAPDKTIVFNLTTRMLVMTSNPYCQIVVNYVANIAITFERVLPPGAKEEQRHIMNKNKESSTKTFGGLLPESRTAEVGPRNSYTECCPPLFEFDNFVRGLDWNTVDHSAFSSYEFQKNSWCNDDKDGFGTLQRKERQNIVSFKMEVGNPKNCEWLRVCFETANSTSMCMDPKNSVEIVLGKQMLIPTDSDKMRQIVTSIENMHTMRFEWISDIKLLTFSYVLFAYNGAGVNEEMYLDWKWDGSNTNKVSLVKAPYCQARLIHDRLGATAFTDKRKMAQCLQLHRCNCKDPKTPF